MAQQFKRLEAPYSFKSYYSKYPEGYSIFEALLDWLDEVNKMIEILNLTLEEWTTIQTWIQKELESFAQVILMDMLNDGKLLMTVTYDQPQEMLSFIFSDVPEE